MQGTRSRVLVVTDDVLASQYWVQTLSDRFQVLSVTSAEKALEALGKAHDAAQGFDAILTDVNLPKMDGISLLTRARSHWPEVARVIATAKGHLNSALAAINQARVNAYLVRPFEEEEILSTVAQAIETEQGVPLEDLEGLSPRERQILGALRRGLAPRQIAGSYSISEHTVRNHIKSIYRKLGVHSQLELISKLSGVQPGEIASTGA